MSGAERKRETLKWELAKDGGGVMLKRQRRLRRLEIAILVFGVLFGVLEVLAGSPVVIAAVAIIALMVFSLRLNVLTFKSIKRADRPRPDYSLIAALEREVYGRVFEHDEAPPPRTAANFYRQPAATTARRHLRAGSGCNLCETPLTDGYYRNVITGNRFCPDCREKSRRDYRRTTETPGEQHR